MKTINFIRTLAYLALLVSLFLPSKANEMTSEFGEAVKTWEPSVSIHLRILLSPLAEVFDYFCSLRSSDDPEVLWNDMNASIIYWLPMTLTGWLFLLYPALRRIRSVTWRCRVRYFSVAVSMVGTGVLIHQLVDWATLYEGYYHMGIGGYFLMSAYVFFTLYVFLDASSKEIEQSTADPMSPTTDAKR